MNNNIYEIMSAVSPLFGVCSFEKVADKLIPCRAMSRLPKGATSVITAAFPYYLGEGAYSGLNVSKYAVVRDYHEVLGAKLAAACGQLKVAYPAGEFEWFVDNSPVPEVLAGCLCGLGVKGENGLLITREYGSYVFIGEIVTTLDLPLSEPATGGCDRCGECAAKCPAQAIAGGRIDSVKCLSAVTQRKGELSQAEKELVISNNSAWGCDVCQNICPMNKNIKTTETEEFILSAVPHVTKQTDINGRAFAWRGKDTIARNLTFLEKEQKQ